MCVSIASNKSSSSSFIASMEKIQSWLANAHSNNNNNNNNSNNQTLLSKSPSISSSSATTSSTSTSQETHSAPTLCADSSFNSLKSTADSIPKPSLSHFCIASIKPSTSQISCLAVQNNNLLYAASLKEINVFDLTTYELIDTFGSGSGLVKSISFSGEKIFSAHQDCRIRVWQKVKNQHHQLISTLPTLQDRFLKSLLAKNYVQIRRHEKKLWIEHADSVSGLAVNNDVGLMYSVSWDKSLKVWKTTSDIRCVGSVEAHFDAVNAVAVNPSDGTVYTGCADGEIRAWRASSRKPSLLSTLKKHESSVNALALTLDGSVLCSGGGDGVIHVWEKVMNGENNEEHKMFVVCSLRGHKGAVLCLVCVNGVIISGSSDRTVRVWKPGKEYYSCLGILEGHCKPVKSLVAIPGPGDLGDDEDDSLTVFSGSLDGEIRAWKVVINSDDRD